MHGILPRDDERGIAPNKDDMLRYSVAQKRRIAAFILVLVLALLTPLPPLLWFHSPAAFLYMGLVLAWALSMGSRILQRDVRRLLSVCCGFMAGIFVLRICRYDVFREFAPVSEYALYLYGVCYTMAALLSFLTALRVGREETARSRLPAVLWTAEGLLCAAMLTNRLHGKFYEFAPGTLDIVTHGPVYFLMVIWCAAFAVAAIVLLLIRCRNSRSRRHWYLPAAGFALGAGLLVWYFAAGGAPKVGIYKLFNLQEAFCLTVILPFEGIFRIGLIPTNSDYELFFRSSSVKAAIRNAAGETVLASPSFEPAPRDGERMQRAPIPGGSVVWFEDVGELLRLRQELTGLNEELDAENELIRQEKDLREEQIAYETRNRLYDSISEALHPQAEAMKKLLESPETAEPDFRRRLQYALVMGAYMKRMGNLMLLADGKRTLPAEELALSVGESFEYLRLGNVACDLVCLGSGEVPASRLLLCYRVFEHFTEANWASLHACRVELLPGDGILLRMAMDCPDLRGAEAEGLLSPRDARELSLETAQEDDTWFITLRRAGAGEEAGA